jgi:hypothetical protein
VTDITVPLFRAAGGQGIPGIRVAHTRDHLPHRFDHQFGLILVDVVATVAGNGEARLRDEGSEGLVRRSYDRLQRLGREPCRLLRQVERPWARTARGIGLSGVAAAASCITTLFVPYPNVSRSP